jgi:hypothetical protein
MQHGLCGIFAAKMRAAAAELGSFSRRREWRHRMDICFRQNAAASTAVMGCRACQIGAIWRTPDWPLPC